MVTLAAGDEAVAAPPGPAAAQAAPTAAVAGTTKAAADPKPKGTPGAEAKRSPSPPKAAVAAKATEKTPAGGKAAEAAPGNGASAEARPAPGAGGAAAAAAAVAAAAAGAAAPAAPSPKSAPPPVEEPPAEDSTYGLFVDPETAFDAAREATKRLHEVLSTLKVAKGVDGKPAADIEAPARELQLQLLALRRAHRAMAKASEAGRAAEAAARRVADAEYAHLETRRYESACCRAAARRCRTFPTPQLTKLRPFLEGFKEGEGEDEDEEDERADGEGLAERLEAEHRERARLAEELESLERQRAQELEALREREAVSKDLAAKLRVAELALEPVCNLLELRTRPDGGAPPPGNLAQLPAPLQLVYSKFDVLTAFGADVGVSVHLEAPAAAAAAGTASKEQPEKRQRLEGGTVVVAIARSPGKTAGAAQAKAVLRFACSPPTLPSGGGGAGPGARLVGVACEAGTPEALLENLWPEDDGAAGPLASAAEAAKVPGRPYAWAQVLAGLRETALPLVAGLASGGGSLVSGAGVTAADVVQRVRARLT